VTELTAPVSSSAVFQRQIGKKLPQSNASTDFTGGPLTGGSIASIFGSGFSSANTYASVIPLPDNLDSVSVTIGGFPALLLFVGPKQINLQVPWGVSGTMADVVVTVNGTPFAPYPASIAGTSPAVFTTQSRVGQAIAINPDGSLAGAERSIPGTLAHPAKAGDPLVILATGLGPVTPQSPTARIPRIRNETR
jgi:uncharacterized protein (TIGR03437 family)